MRELLKHYFNIAFLMGKPQDLPAGNAQMQIGILLAFVTYVLALSGAIGFGRAAMQGVLDLAGTGVLAWFVLSQTGKLARLQQAFGGLCGASAFINLASWPIYSIALNSQSITQGAQTEPSLVPALALFVMLVWSLSLIAHVIRHTFGVTMVVSILVAFVYVYIWSSVITTLVPAPAATLSSSASSSVSFEQVSTFELVASSTTML